MLTESDLQTPAWLAAIVSGQCVIIRGHVGEHRLEGLKAVLPLGVFQWAPLELPQGEALDPEFFASIMPALLGEVPRKVYVMPLVASSVQIDALAEVRANQPWLQWVAVVPDPEIDPVLPDGILLFDTKARAFADENKIPAPILAWAKKVLGGARSEEEKKRAVCSEGPKILATINSVSVGEYQNLPAIMGKCDSGYVSQLVTIAVEIAGVEGVDPEHAAAEIEECASIDDIIAPDAPPLADPQVPAINPPKRPPGPIPSPQIFENGKALPIYPPGDPAGRYSRELDAVRRDPEAHGALLEILQEFPCDDGDGQQPTCADRCNDPAQKWACMRDKAWSAGMPTAIVDHWLEVFAIMVAHIGRNPREAYQSFTNIILQVSGSSPTFSATNFAEMVKQNGVPIPPVRAPAKPVKTAPALVIPSSPPRESPKNSIPLPLPLKPLKQTVRPESRPEKLLARLDALAEKLEKLRTRLTAAPENLSSPQPANDRLAVPSVAGSWEAGDVGDEDFSLDALERRAARFAQRK